MNIRANRGRSASRIMAAFMLGALALGTGAAPALSGSVQASTPVVQSDWFRLMPSIVEWENAVYTNPSGLWLSKCKKGKQKAIFTTTINIPGPPSTVHVTLKPYGIVKKALIKLNGSTLVKGAGIFKEFNGDLSPVDVGRFLYGENVVEIVAIKKPTDEGATPVCGINFTIQGYFDPDIAVDPKPAEIFLQSPYIEAIGSFTVINNGPSGSPGGTFTASYSNASSVYVESASAPFDAANCTSGTGTIHCHYGTHAEPDNQSYFPVGGTATIALHFFFFNPDGEPAPQTDGGTLLWDASAAGEDPEDWANNEGSTRVWVCDDDDDSPPAACDGAAIEEGNEEEPPEV